MASKESKTPSKALGQMLSKDWVDPKKNNPTKLLANIKALADALFKVESGEDLDLKGVTSILASKSILETDQVAMKLPTALALAEIIRLTAPDSPFTASQLEIVFDHLIDQLEGLADPTSPDANSIYRLLERLAGVNAFFLIADVKELRERIFHILFDSISEKNKKKVVVHASSILTSIINDAEVIDMDLVRCIFAPLIDTQTTDQGPRLLAHQILASDVSKRLLPAVGEALDKIMTQAEKGDQNVLSQLHRLVYELYSANPAFLDLHLMRFENDLKSPTLEVRSATTHLLATLFSQKTARPLAVYGSLIAPFLDRFRDAHDAVRMAMCRDFSAVFAINHPTDPALPAIFESLGSCLIDREEKVRAAACESIGSIANNDSTLIPPPLVENLIALIRDKKEIARREAVAATCIMYKSHSNRYGSQSAWPSDTLSKLIATIPSKLITGLRGDVDNTVILEEALQEKLLPPRNEDPTADDVIYLVELIGGLDPQARVELCLLLKSKQHFSSAFKFYLEQRGGSNDKMDPTLMAKIQFMSRQLPHHTSTEAFLRIHQISDKRLFQSLATLADPIADSKRVISARNTIETLFLRGEDPKLKQLIPALIQRLSILNLTSTFVAKLVEQASGLLENQNLRKVLSDLAFLFPQLFDESLKSLESAITDQDEEISSFSLRVLSRIGHLFVDSSELTHPLRAPLSKIALSGNVPQSKYAIKALKELFKYEHISALLAKSAKTLSTLVQKESISQFTEGHLLALKQLALAAPSAFSNVAGSLIDYIVDNLLVVDEFEELSAVSDLARAKVAGLKVLREFVQMIKTQTGKEQQIDRVFDALFNLIETNIGAGIDAENASHLHSRAHVLVGAAKIVLQLSVDRRLDLKVDPLRFIHLAEVAIFTIADVRRAFLKALRKGLASIQMGLPIRYLALVALYGADLVKELVTEARALLRQTVNARRDLIKSLPPADTTEGESRRRALFPEMAMPYLVYTLSHYSLFEPDSEQGFAETLRCLAFYFDAVWLQDNAVYFLDHLNTIKALQDRLFPESNAIHVVAEIGVRYITSQAEKKRVATSKTTKVQLPPTLFMKPATPISHSEPLLPPDFSPTVKKQSRAAPSRKGPSVRGDIASESEIDPSSMDLEQALPPPPPRRVVPSPQKNQKRARPEAEQPIESPMKKPRLSASPSKTPRKLFTDFESTADAKDTEMDGEPAKGGKKKSAKKRIVDPMELDMEADKTPEKEKVDAEKPSPGVRKGKSAVVKVENTKTLSKSPLKQTKLKTGASTPNKEKKSKQAASPPIKETKSPSPRTKKVSAPKPTSKKK